MRLAKALILVALIGWLFQSIDKELLWQALLKLNPLGIFLTFLAVFFSDLVISYRWYYLSRFRYSFKASLEANMLAFFLNIFAPAKLGDLSKIYYMQKSEGHDPKESTSIFFIERLFDVLILGGMILFSALFILPSQKALFIGAVLLLCVLFFVWLLLHPRLLRRFVKLIPFQAARVLIYKVIKLTKANLSLERTITLLFLTLAVWASYYLNNFVFFLSATDFNLSLKEIFIASTLAFGVSAIPITPGGIGTFQAAFILALGWYGISKEEALSASIVLQLLYILPATIYSLYLFITKDFLGRRNVSTTKL